MKTKHDKIVEILKEASQIHVKTDDPEEVWVLSSSDNDDTFSELATAIESLYEQEAKERYEKAVKYWLDNYKSDIDYKENALRIASGLTEKQ